MARKRLLSPEFFTDAKLVSLPPLTRLLFQGLWCHADRIGVLRDDAADLHLRILPRDNFDAEEALNQLADAGQIVRYEVDGQRYIFVRHFTRHQRPHKNEQGSNLPLVTEKSRIIRGSLNGSASAGHFSAKTQLSAGNGNGNGNGVEDLHEPNRLVLSPPTSAKKARALSKQQSFYLWAKERRLTITDAPDRELSISRINTTLKPAVDGCEPIILSEAFDLFLAAERPGTLDPPWPMWAFANDWSVYVSKAKRQEEKAFG